MPFTFLSKPQIWKLEYFFLYFEWRLLFLALPTWAPPVSQYFFFSINTLTPCLSPVLTFSPHGYPIRVLHSSMHLDYPTFSQSDRLCYLKLLNNIPTLPLFHYPDLRKSPFYLFSRRRSLSLARLLSFAIASNRAFNASRLSWPTPPTPAALPLFRLT